MVIKLINVPYFGINKKKIDNFLHSNSVIFKHQTFFTDKLNLKFHENIDENRDIGEYRAFDYLT